MYIQYVIPYVIHHLPILILVKIKIKLDYLYPIINTILDDGWSDYIAVISVLIVS